MYHVGAQDVDERMINVHYYYYLQHLVHVGRHRPLLNHDEHDDPQTHDVRRKTEQQEGAGHGEQQFGHLGLRAAGLPRRRLFLRAAPRPVGLGSGSGRLAAVGGVGGQAVVVGRRRRLASLWRE